MPPKVDN